MARFTFTKATKQQSRARIALIGPSGSGKTMTALRIARGMGGRVALIDTEHGSASKYADMFDFDVLCLDSFAPATYVDAIAAADDVGYDIVIIDSLSHAWAGKDGALEQVDRAASRAGGTFQAWRDVTPQHNRLVEAIVGARCHVIATMRAKMKHALEEYEEGGRKKTRVVKLALDAVQRDGMEYEFDIVADLTADHHLLVSKTRCQALDGLATDNPGEDLGRVIRDWLDDGHDPLDDWRADADAAEASGSLKAFLGPEGLQVKAETAPAHIRVQAREVIDGAMCRVVVAHVDQLDRDQLARVRQVVDVARVNGDRDKALAAIDGRLGALAQATGPTRPSEQGHPEAAQAGLDLEVA